jgi:hypothetical protein
MNDVSYLVWTSPCQPEKKIDPSILIYFYFFCSIVEKRLDQFYGKFLLQQYLAGINKHQILRILFYLTAQTSLALVEMSRLIKGSLVMGAQVGMILFCQGRLDL